MEPNELKWEGYRYNKDRLRDPSAPPASFFPVPDAKCLEGKSRCSGCGVQRFEPHSKTCPRLARYVETTRPAAVQNEAYPMYTLKDGVALATPAKGAHRSDGGSTDYYAIPTGTRDLDDLIDGLGMSFRIANIFKACMRFGKKDGTSQLYDLNKIIFFASRERDKLLALGTEVVAIDLPVNRSVE